MTTAARRAEFNVTGLTLTHEFKHALRAVSEGRHVFITGRAGTGKSTLLSLIRSAEAARPSAVVAPTGVAALNVAGETIHSFFAFRPSLSPELREYRPPVYLADIDMLIVDEVSMARADLLDMMDVALRRRRRDDEPFGGVQMVFVGDLYQLPPVVVDDEHDATLRHYASPFFFSAEAFRRLSVETIELTEVFRQRDDRFIALLNAVRDGTATEAELAELNERVDPDRAAAPGNGAITLTTTNRAADAVNRSRLEALGSPIHRHQGTVTGDFDPSRYRAELDLSYAVGAQVMTLVNGERFVNGSLGEVVEIASESGQPRVHVRLRGTDEVVGITPHRWEVTRPVRQGDGGVRSEVVGSFTQLPLRLAWAVTVHKSQGKTFEQVVFDRGRSVFAAGQLYVALSRCVSLEGLTLKHPLRLRDVITDTEVRRFHAKATASRRRFGDPPKSFVGFVETGGSSHSKLAEIAVIRQQPGDEPVVFTSLVNPMRDITEAVEAGITAGDVAAAPSVAELRRLLAALLHGTVLVTQDSARLSRLLDWHGTGADEGVSVDLRDHNLEFEPQPSDSAYDRASLVSRHARPLADARLPMEPLDARDVHPQRGDYALPREPYGDTRALAKLIERHDNLPPRAKLDLLLALAPGASNGARELTDRAAALARAAGLDGEDLREAAHDVCNSLLSAPSGNGPVSERATAAITTVADAFQLDVSAPDGQPTSPALKLTAGARVCFTGSPPSGEEHAHLTKDRLRAAAATAGLEETPTVTKRKCDVLVAYDPCSMSGKAKKAREYGKPIVSAEQFLELIEHERRS